VIGLTESEPSAAVGSSVLFENSAVRVWQMTLAPGEACEFHRHHHDHLILYPMPGKMRGQNPGDDDWTIVQDTETGFVMYRTAGTTGPLLPHRLLNAGDETVTHYIVELLGPTATPEPISENNGKAHLLYANPT
jgi:hypothetical protein